MKKEKIQIRRLRGTDAVSVKELDEISGNNVFQYIENVGPLQETEDAWGIFDNGLLLGYCSTGGADGVISVPGMRSDAILLSDVFVRPECRGVGVATVMLTEILPYFDDTNVYLTYLDERLEWFYKPLGFRRVSGEDTVMLKRGGTADRDDGMSWFEVRFINGDTLAYTASSHKALSEEDAVRLAFRSHGSGFEHELISVRKLAYFEDSPQEAVNREDTVSNRSGERQVERLIARTEDMQRELSTAKIVVDPDTIIADLINKSGDFGFPGIAEDIFCIWRNSKDKSSVEQMFYEFTGCEFKDYLETCLRETREIDVSTNPAGTSADADVSGVVAVDIEWDASEPEDLESLPEEVEIPKNVVEQQKDNPDAISDYLSELTGFCHKGFAIIDHTETRELIRSGKVW